MKKTGTWWKPPLTPSVVALRKPRSRFFLFLLEPFLQSLICHAWCPTSLTLDGSFHMTHDPSAILITILASNDLDLDAVLFDY